MTLVSLAKACDWLGRTGKGRERALRVRLQRLEKKTGHSLLVSTGGKGSGVRYRVDLDAVRRHAPHLRATQRQDFSTELSICFKKIDKSIHEMREAHARDVAELREDVRENRDDIAENKDALIGVVRRVTELSERIPRR